MLRGRHFLNSSLPPRPTRARSPMERQARALPRTSPWSRLLSSRASRWFTFPSRAMPKPRQPFSAATLMRLQTPQAGLHRSTTASFGYWSPGAQREPKTGPHVPTLKEVGVDMVSNSPYGLAGPKGMAPEIVNVLHDAFRQGLDDPSNV